LPLAEQLSRLGKNFIQAIRSRPLTQEILAWEMVERNKLTAELETIRENTMMNFFDMFFPAMNNGPDIAAVGAIIGGGVSYLVTRARQIHLYNGVDLQSEAGWQRLEKAIDTIKVLDQNEWIIGVDPLRRLPAVDPHNRETLLSIGAFAENVALAAGRFGLNAEIELLAANPFEQEILKVSLSQAKPVDYPLQRITGRMTVKHGCLPDEIKKVSPAASAASIKAVS
jgi:hypothetical protein